MKRRKVLKTIGVFGIATPFSLLLAENRGMMGMGGRRGERMGPTAYISATNGDFSRSLAIPPLAKYKIKNNRKYFNLNVKEGEHNFLGKNVPTYGINGDYLGPTIKVNHGDKVSMDVENNINETTSLHWHGLWVDGKNDGTPHQAIKPKKKWNPEFTIDNKACTLWYHPHPHGTTGPQVYKGLAGMFIIEDENSKKLDLPMEYGVDDIPLIVQDRYFDNDKNMVYFTDFRTRMMGMRGNTLLVNGTFQPTFRAKKDLIRFRILNGSNATVWNMNFSDDREFYQVATDAGLLEKPVKMNNITLAPAERAEIVVDVSDKAENLYFQHKDYQQGATNVMKIDTKNTERSSHKKLTSSYKLNTIKRLKEEDVNQYRTMDMKMFMGRVSINNKTMNMNRIDEEVRLGDVEIWSITNNKEMRMGMSHPFHMHGTSFMILSRDGQEPLAHERGLKDVVLVAPGETVKIIMQFNHKADNSSPYMYHCHILEHEDRGMMGQFIVT